jgi:lipopolysaccharide export system permease protein
LIINRYLIREMALPLVTVTAVLVVIFMSYNAVRYTADAAAGLLPGSTVLQLTLLRSLIAIEVLLPVALYLSVVMGMGRLYSDNEMVALYANGFSELRVVRSVLWLSLAVAIVVASLSLAVRPWAYYKSYLLKAEAEAEFNLDKLEAGQFYSAEESGTVIFVERINRVEKRLEQVYFFKINDKSVGIISARQAWQPVTDPFASPVLKFLDGNEYLVDLTGSRDLTLKFKQLSLLLKGNDEELERHRSKATGTLKLAKSSNPDDLAEFQWRLTTPFTTLLLGVLGVPLSRSAPRRGRYSKTMVAALFFAFFYNFNVMAKNWVEQGIVGAIPGVWWPQVLLGFLIIALLFLPILRSRVR